MDATKEQQTQPAPTAPEPAAPAPPSIQPKPNKGPLLVAVALILLLLGSTAYLGYQNWQLTQKISEVEKQTQAPSPKASPDGTTDQAPTGDLANWKTYSNESIGFSLKYPEALMPSACKDGVHFFETLSGLTSSEYCETPPYGIISLDYGKNPLTPGFEKSEDFKVTKTSITIDGVKAKKQKVEKLKDAPGPDYAIYVLFSNESYYYNISLLNQSYGETFDQILSTFQFID